MLLTTSQRIARARKPGATAPLTVVSAGPVWGDVFEALQWMSDRTRERRRPVLRQGDRVIVAEPLEVDAVRGGLVYVSMEGRISPEAYYPTDLAPVTGDGSIELWGVEVNRQLIVFSDHLAAAGLAINEHSTVVPLIAYRKAQPQGASDETE